MKLLFAASEGAPYIKSGGLGDVIYALPTELANDPENEIIIFLPLYAKIKRDMQALGLEYVTDFTLPLGWRTQYVGVFTAKGEKSNIRYYFIDNEFYFDRPAIYGHFDDGERFAYFSKAIVETMLRLDITPDVLHCHDWQTALVPLFLKASYSHVERFNAIKTVFTIHNIEYQGVMPESFFGEIIGVDAYWYNLLHFDGALNFMKAAIHICDRVTTVSRTYSYEIRHAYFGHGLQDVLTQHGYKLSGIVNGIDPDTFNPRTDPRITQTFGTGHVKKKLANKLALQERLGLPIDPDVPMVAMITRLVGHKGVDLVEFVAHDMMQLPIQFVLIGTGDAEYEQSFTNLQAQYPQKMSANILFDMALAQQLYAASDLFLMPSKSEPCGLSQLIAMRYGSIPIVRETGGLYDTVQPIDSEELTGRGFTFKSYNAHDMLDAVRRGVDFYYEDKKKLNAIIRKLMSCDFSWKVPVVEYMELYRNI